MKSEAVKIYDCGCMMMSFIRNPASLDQFREGEAHYQYYYFEGISHRLILNFSIEQPEL